LAVRQFLEEEHAAALAFARRPIGREVRGFLRVSPRAWELGIARVRRLPGGLYTPDAEGELAFITPYCEEGQIVDLVAASFKTTATATRLGIASVLGAAAIDRARQEQGTLILFATPWKWLRAPTASALVLAWNSAPWLLADVRSIWCESDNLRQRVARAFFSPVPVPRLRVGKPDRHASGEAQRA